MVLSSNMTHCSPSFTVSLGGGRFSIYPAFYRHCYVVNCTRGEVTFGFASPTCHPPHLLAASSRKITRTAITCKSRSLFLQYCTCSTSGEFPEFTGISLEPTLTSTETSLQNYYQEELTVGLVRNAGNVGRSTSGVHSLPL